jgi:hypothetical protein
VGGGDSSDRFDPSQLATIAKGHNAQQRALVGPGPETRQGGPATGRGA